MGLAHVALIGSTFSVRRAHSTSLLQQPLALKVAVVAAAAFAAAVILRNEFRSPSSAAGNARPTRPPIGAATPLPAAAALPENHPPITYPTSPSKGPAFPPKQVIDDLFALQGADPGTHLALVGELVQNGEAAIPFIAEAFARADYPAVRHGLADALSRIGTRSAIELLIAQAADEQTPAARANLLKALNSLSHPEGLRVLATGLLVFDDPVVRQSAAHALGQRAQPDTIDYLAVLHREAKHLPQKTTVLMALADVRNPAAVPGLRQAIDRTADPAVLEAAVKSLAKIGTPSAIQCILDTLNKSSANRTPELRVRLLDSLAHIRNPSSIYFIDTSLQFDKLPSDTVEALKHARRLAGAE